MIQIHNMSDALHRRLKSRAALAGMSLSDYLLGEIREVLEVAQVIRCYAAAGEIGPERGVAAVTDLADMPLRRYSHDILLPRVWALRHNLTGYDAVYVALAEALDAPLPTRDQRMVATAGHRARIELV